MASSAVRPRRRRRSPTRGRSRPRAGSAGPARRASTTTSSSTTSRASSSCCPRRARARSTSAAARVGWRGRCAALGHHGRGRRAVAHARAGGARGGPVDPARAAVGATPCRSRPAAPISSCASWCSRTSTTSTAVCREIARLLAPDGVACTAIVHPVASSGFPDPDGEFQYVGRYLDVMRNELRVERLGVEFTFHSAHRPIEHYSRAFEAAGLVIEAHPRAGAVRRARRAGAAPRPSPAPAELPVLPRSRTRRDAARRGRRLVDAVHARSRCATPRPARSSGSGRAPHPPTAPPVSEQDPQAWWDALVAARAEAGHADDGRRDLGRRAAARSRRPRRRGHAAPPGEALERHRVRARRRLAARAARRRRRRRGPTRAARCRSPRSRSPSCRGCTAPSPTCSPGSQRVMLPHDWLAWRLTGEYGTDRGDASGTGYWSPADGRVPHSTCSRSSTATSTGPPLLPPVLGPELAHGTGDNMAAALGLGLRPGDVAISLGTSGTVFAVSDTPTADPTGAVAGFADATGRFLPLVCTLNATKVTDAIAPLARRRPRRARRAGARGAAGRRRRRRSLPYFDGERTPNRPDATRPAHRPARRRRAASDVARAAFEGVVCGLLDGLDALVAAGVARRRPALPRRRRRPQRRVPADRRRPRAAARRRRRRRRARRARRVRAGRGPRDRSPDRRGAGRVGARAGHDDRPDRVRGRGTATRRRRGAAAST